MSDVKWIKLSTEIFDNRKIRQIESMPDGDALVVIWLKLLILAGEINDGGCVYFTRDIPFTDQLLATQFNRPLATIQLALQTFQRFGMIEIINDLILVSNWEKYQNIDGLEKIREQTRNRVRNYRQRQLTGNVTGNVTVTDGNATDIDIEKEQEKEKKNKYGEYSHVLLKKSEVEKLNQEYGKDTTSQCIRYLDEYIEMKGYKAKSHYLCIKKWVVDAVRERQRKTPQTDYLQRTDSMGDVLMDL